MLLFRPAAKLLPFHRAKLPLNSSFSRALPKFISARQGASRASSASSSSLPSSFLRFSLTSWASMGRASEHSTQKHHAAVLYHYPCHDGVFAALAANLYHHQTGLNARFIPHTVYNPMRVEEVPVDDVEVVYLLDFAGPPGFAVELSKRAKRVVLLDHHKTAAESLPPPELLPKNLETVIDMGRSGATISWDYFSALLATKQGGSGGLVEGEDKARVQQLFDYIEDADLWHWALPDSKEFSCGLGDSKIEFNPNLNTELFDQLLALRHEDLVERGREGLVKKQLLIDDILSRSFGIRIGGAESSAGGFGTCLAVNADQVSHVRSELGNQLAEKSGAAGLRSIGAVAYTENAMADLSKTKVSLRSKGEEDTTPISQRYGGGGHKNASSFTVDRNEFQSWRIQE